MLNTTNHAGGGWRGGEGRRVNSKSKKDLAMDFINAIRGMDPAVLNGLIVREAGEDLAQFFLSYSASLISKDPNRVLENTSSLMLMGYLIRSHEDKSTQLTSSPLQAYALA
jgi:hypothetical protein